MRHSPLSAPTNRLPDLICLSHLRWNFVFQRPQHLMSRYARTRRVYFFEEPILCDVAEPQLRFEAHDGVTVVVPHVPQSVSVRSERSQPVTFRPSQ